MATLINRIENMTMAHLSHKQRTSFMYMNSVPKRTWKRIIMKLCFVVIFLIFCSPYSSYASHDPWGENLQPKLHTDYLNEYSDLADHFLGNSTHVDYFKLLRKDGSSLLIGARNVIYNLSLPDLKENIEQRITWNPLEVDQSLCLLKGKTHDDCQNYIRVLAQTDDERLLVCGTNAYNPKCRYYSHNISNTNVDEEFSGRGFCPYDPRHNSTSLYTDGELYSGTVADFSASDSLIIKNVTSAKKWDNRLTRLRTEQYDFKQLNAPDFVSTLEDNDHVYFFFRESAVEHINCGKSIFPRVARVCKNDSGGPHKFKNKWTTFLKARLNCSVPGDIPFYFDEIQATVSNVVSGSHGSLNDGIIYAVFTTPENSIAGSAICAFSLKDITTAFEEGEFKHQNAVNSNWLPVPKSQVPVPRPGICHSSSYDEHYNKTSTTEEQRLNFIRRHSLMDWSVPGLTQSPIFVKTSLGERLTVIAVDVNVRAVNGKLYDVLFLGTTNGRVLKVINIDEDEEKGRTPKSRNQERALFGDNKSHFQNNESRKRTHPVLIESLQVLPYNIPVRNLMVINRKDADILDEDKLIVLSDHDVKSIPLQRCSTHAMPKSCGDCVALQDPYCAWDQSRQQCVEHSTVSLEADIFGSFPSSNDNLIQQLETGFHTECPPPDVFSIDPVHTEENTEEDDVSSLSLSNSTTNDVDVQNSTIANIDTSKGNDEKLKLKTNNTENLKEICSNQCSCDICKDSFSENLSSLKESRLDNEPNQENVNQSSKNPSVPTFVPFYDIISANNVETEHENEEEFDEAQNTIHDPVHGSNGKKSRNEKELNILRSGHSFEANQGQDSSYDIRQGNSNSDLDNGEAYSPYRNKAVTDSSITLYTGETLAASTICTAIIALIVGFIIGLMFTGRKGRGTNRSTSSMSGNDSGNRSPVEFAANGKLKMISAGTEIYDKTLKLKRRAAAALSEVGNRCSDHMNAHNTHQQHPTSANASDITVSGMSVADQNKTVTMPGVGLRKLAIEHPDSGYTTPSNLTNTSVTTQATSISSSGSQRMSSAEDSSTSSNGSSSPPSSNSTSPMLHSPGNSSLSSSVLPRDLPVSFPACNNLLQNMPQKSETIKVPPVKVSQTMSMPLGSGLVVQPLPNEGRPCSIASTSSVSFPPYHPATLRHYHYNQSPTPSAPSLRLSPNELQRTIPRNQLGAGQERSALSRQSSAQLPISDGNRNTSKHAVTSMNPGATLQKAKRMYI